jgi:hypothetical protein
VCICLWVVRVKPILIGFALSCIFFPPAAMVLVIALAQEVSIRADREAARSIMRQIRPGVQDCYVERGEANCTAIIKGKRRTFVLAAVKLDN